MSRFLDLPIELLPDILRHIIKPHHLALCCLVNKTFLSFTIPQLYASIYIYAWHANSKIKVGMKLTTHWSQLPTILWNAIAPQIINLFTTLAKRPDFAKWVKKLGIKFLRIPPPLSMTGSLQTLEIFQRPYTQMIYMNRWPPAVSRDFQTAQLSNPGPGPVTKH